MPQKQADVRLSRAQTDMGGDTATRAAEDGAKAIAWAYLSPKVRSLRRSRPAVVMHLPTHI